MNILLEVRMAKKLEISGSANSTGFVIKGSKIVISSKEHGLTRKLGLRFYLSLVFVIMPCWSVIFMSYFFPDKLLDLIVNINWPFSLRTTFALPYLWLAASGFIYMFTLSKRTKQWHGCEHKVASLIESGLVLAMENLKKMSRVTLDCGSQTSFCSIIASFVTFLLLNFTMIGLEWQLSLYPSVFIFLYVLLDALSFPLPTQYLVTQEPTEEQLQEGLRVAKEFKAKLGGRN